VVQVPRLSPLHLAPVTDGASRRPQGRGQRLAFATLRDAPAWTLGAGFLPPLAFRPGRPRRSPARLPPPAGRGRPRSREPKAGKGAARAPVRALSPPPDCSPTPIVPAACLFTLRRSPLKLRVFLFPGVTPPNGNLRTLRVFLMPELPSPRAFPWFNCSPTPIVLPPGQEPREGANCSQTTIPFRLLLPLLRLRHQ